MYSSIGCMVTHCILQLADFGCSCVLPPKGESARMREHSYWLSNVDDLWPEIIQCSERCLLGSPNEFVSWFEPGGWAGGKVGKEK